MEIWGAVERHEERQRDDGKEIRVFSDPGFHNVHADDDLSTVFINGEYATDCNRTSTAKCLNLRALWASVLFGYGMALYKIGQ